MRRALKHIIIFGILGVVMSYLVAWGLAWRGQPPRSVVLPEGANGRWRIRDVSTGSPEYVRLQRFGWLPRRGMNLDRYVVTRTEWQTFGRISYNCTEDWVLIEGSSIIPNGGPPSVWIVSGVVAGWPIAMLRGELWGPKEVMHPSTDTNSRSPRPDWACVWKCSFETLGFIQPRAIILPLRPLWPGLVVNSAFYGLLLWLLSLVPSIIRRGLRRRRGRCVKCGYDLRGNPAGGCPECGDSGFPQARE